MNARKNNARANVQSTMQNDVRDVENAFKFTTTNDIETQSNVVVTLKQIIIDHKIKCDAKLIRRVLRKYHAQKINHQHRDAWVFQQNDVKNVVALIDKHCRSMKSSNA